MHCWTMLRISCSIDIALRPAHLQCMLQDEVGAPAALWLRAVRQASLRDRWSMRMKTSSSGIT